MNLTTASLTVVAYAAGKTKELLPLLEGLPWRRLGRRPRIESGVEIHEHLTEESSVGGHLFLTIAFDQEFGESPCLDFNRRIVSVEHQLIII